MNLCHSVFGEGFCFTLDKVWKIERLFLILPLILKVFHKGSVDNIYNQTRSVYVIKSKHFMYISKLFGFCYETHL